MRPKVHRGSHSQLYSVQRSKAMLLYPKLVAISQSVTNKALYERLGTLKGENESIPHWHETEKLLYTSHFGLTKQVRSLIVLGEVDNDKLARKYIL